MQSIRESASTEDYTLNKLLILPVAGKQIGQKPGIKLTTKKSVTAKDIIQKHNKSFGGSLNDVETIRQAGVSRKTFYKYKRELLSGIVE